MTNAEKNFDKVMHFASEADPFGINGDDKMQPCNRLSCSECILNNRNKTCAESREKWLKTEYVEPPVDWSKVPVDTKILVRDYENKSWEKRYFAKYKDNTVYAWGNGTTSWTNDDDYTTEWNYAKLAEE